MDGQAASRAALRRHRHGGSGVGEREFAVRRRRSTECVQRQGPRRAPSAGSVGGLPRPAVRHCRRRGRTKSERQRRATASKLRLLGRGRRAGRSGRGRIAGCGPSAASRPQNRPPRGETRKDRRPQEDGAVFGPAGARAHPAQVRSGQARPAGAAASQARLAVRPDRTGRRSSRGRTPCGIPRASAAEPARSAACRRPFPSCLPRPAGTRRRQGGALRADAHGRRQRSRCRPFLWGGRARS